MGLAAHSRQTAQRGSEPGLLSILLLWAATTVLGIWYGFQYLIPAEWVFQYFSAGSIVFFLAAIGVSTLARVRTPFEGLVSTGGIGLLLSTLSLVQSLFFFSKSLPVSWILVALTITGPSALFFWRGRQRAAILWLAFLGLLACSVVALREPLNVAAANMLPIIQAACADIAVGVNPYTKTYPEIGSLPIHYFPALWLPYCPMELASVDPRWLNVVLNAAVVVVLARACGAPDRWNAFGACVLPIMLSPTFLQMLIHGHLWPYWLMIALTLLFLVRGRLNAAVTTLAVGLGMRQLALFIAAPLGASLLDGGARAIVTRVVIAAAVLSVMLVPAALAVDSFVSHFFMSIARAAADLNVLPGNPHNQVALSGLFPIDLSPLLLQMLQAAVVLAGFALAFFIGRGRPSRAVLLVAGSTYLLAVGLNPFVSRYFYVPGLMVLLVAIGRSDGQVKP